VTVDQQFKDWWAHKGRPPLPSDHVLPVLKALQGHPESSRLWAQLINAILVNKLNLKPTTHEPCLYSGKYDNHKIYFLRQVDDFAIACESESIAKSIIAKINSHMSVDIKYLGLLTRFNGVDILQTSDYVKIYNATYIDKILTGHQTWMEPRHCHNMPIPMKSEPQYSRHLESTSPPVTDKERYLLQKEMGINYRQAIGELIYAMVTCRPDISFPLIKLSQYSSNPAREHYLAVKEIFYYLQCTRDDGIHFWRHHKNHKLPSPPHSFDTWILNAHGLGIFNRRNFLDLDTGRIKANLQVDVKIEFDLDIRN